MSTFVLSLYALCRIEQTIGSQRLHCLPEHELICERFDRYTISIGINRMLKELRALIVINYTIVFSAEPRLTTWVPCDAHMSITTRHLNALTVHSSRQVSGQLIRRASQLRLL